MDYGEASDLYDLNHGIVKDLFPDALREVLDNVSDENTAATAERSITISIKFKPTKDRAAMDSTVEVKTKLAPPKANESRLLLSSDGRETTAHFLKDEPAQPELGDIAEFPGKAGGGNA